VQEQILTTLISLLFFLANPSFLQTEEKTLVVFFLQELFQSYDLFSFWWPGKERGAILL